MLVAGAERNQVIAAIDIADNDGAASDDAASSEHDVSFLLGTHCKQACCVAKMRPILYTWG